MKHILILLSILLLSSPLFGQSERPETIIIPVSGIGDVSNTRKIILQNTLEEQLKEHFMLISQERFEEVREKVFEELEYEECTEDRCIMMIQEMLQVENVFHLQVIGEGSNTQLSLSWRTLEEKKKVNDICMGCGTFQLNDKVMGLVEKLVGVKKVFTDEPVVQKIEKDKTEGLFVSVGDPGTILTSPDGNSWTKRTSGISKYLYGVTYGNRLFVTVGESGTILTSSDGIFSWTKRTSGTFDYLSGVTYGNGLFVTVGWRTILTSSDGTTWTQRTSGISKYLYGVTYGNRLFVTVGDSGTILTSSDGNSWTQRNSGISKYLYGVTYGKGLFVTVGLSGTILTSPDGTTWTQRNSGTSDLLIGVTYENGLFVTVGESGTILTSPDGTTWTERTSGTPEYLIGVTYGNGLFVTVGYLGTIFTSTDGTSWTKRTSGTSKYLRGVTYSQ